jgi:hypothetical protein
MTPKMLAWSIQADSTRKTVLRMAVDGLAKESNQLLQAGTMLIPPEISLRCLGESMLGSYDLGRLRE